MSDLLKPGEVDTPSERLLQGSSTRRQLVRRAALLGLSAPVVAALLAACGGDDEDEPAATTAGGSTSTATTGGGTAPTTGTGSTASPATGGTPAGGASVAPEDFDPNARLSIALSSGWKTLDPPLYTGVGERQIFYSIFDPIFDMDENLDVVPALAKSWEISSDGKLITLTLQEGVKFHDGTDFNGDAVKFNIDRILDPETASAQKSNIDAITSVEVVDPLTVELNLSQAFTPLLGNMTEGPGMQGSPTAIQKDAAAYGQAPVGTGPFVFSEWDKGVGITLTRNENYWREGLPRLAELYWQEIPDETVKMANLQSGQVDFVDSVPPKDIESVKSNANYSYWEAEGVRWPMLRLNLAKSPFDNKAFRHAVSLGIDREAIIRAAYFGAGKPAYGPISPVYKSYYTPEVENFGFKRDVAKAKQKLQESGVSNPSFTIDIQNNPTQQRMAELVKSQLTEVGINVDIQVYESTAFTDRITNKLYEGLIGSWTPRPDIDGTIYRHYSTNGNVNSMSYSNPEVDELLEQSRILPNGPERVDVYREIQRLVVEDAPWVFLLFENQVRAWQKKVESIPEIPDTMPRFHTTYVKK